MSGIGAVLPFIVAIILLIIVAYYVWSKQSKKGGIVMETENSNSVRVIDINMPFGSMVAFMVKWAIASIPAFIILIIVGAILAGIAGAVMGGFFKMLL